MKQKSSIRASRFPQFFCLLALYGLSPTSALADSRDQAKRIHDRIAGIAPSEQVLSSMQQLVEDGNAQAAAYMAMDNPAFYNVTLKNWITPWTNRDFDVFRPLNDYSATVIGVIRDDVDFREILSADILYLGDASLGLPAYSSSNNNHFEQLEEQGHSLKDSLVAVSQSTTTGLPAEATAGVVTSRAAAQAFFIAGTNRAMFRFTLINHMCRDLETVKDITRVPDRIRQDVSRSPGGDSRIFNNSCIGCHSGMDPMAQAYAYYQFDYDSEGDPEGDNGQLIYNRQGQVDATTGTRVQSKYWNNNANFPHGFVTLNDDWANYWRQGQNANLGWDLALPGEGSGAKSMGQELANSDTFAQCQVSKVFEDVCLRQPQDQADRDQIDTMTSNFKANGYRLKQVFAESADYCKGV